MVSFEEVMALTRGVSGAEAFNERECAAYFDLATAIPPGSTIVEIGLQFGRSSSIVAQVAKDRGNTYIGVDPFTQPPESGPEWKALMERIGIKPILYEMKTEELPRGWCQSLIYLALIDGCHNEREIRIDCAAVLPLVPVGGHVCFHDYGRESLPEVYPTVNAVMAELPEWHEVGIYGTLGVWKRA